MHTTTTFWLLFTISLLSSLAPLGLMPLPLGVTLPATAIITGTILYTLLRTEAFKSILQTPWPASLLVSALSLTALIMHQPVPTFLPSAWNSLLAPFTHAGLLPLLTPLAFMSTIWVMRSTNHPWLQINRFSLVLFSTLLMWPDGAADLPALGLLFLSLILLLTRQRIQPTELAALILLLAAISTARSIFLYVPLLMGFSLFAVWPRRAAIVTAATYALILLFVPTLPLIPASIALTTELFAALALLAIVLIQSLYHWRWWPAPQHAAWGLGAPLFIVALHNLSETASLAHWYGAIYLTPALPVITYTLLRPSFKHS